MKIFPESVRLQTNTSLKDGNKTEISNWEMDLLSLKKDGAKIVKNLIRKNVKNNATDIFK